MGSFLGSYGICGLKWKEDWARGRVEFNDVTKKASANFTGCLGTKVIHGAGQLA